MSSCIFARAKHRVGYDDYGHIGFWIKPKTAVFTGDLQSAAVGTASVFGKILKDEHLDFGERVDLCDIFLTIMEDAAGTDEAVRAMRIAVRQRKEAPE